MKVESSSLKVFHQKHVTQEDSYLLISQYINFLHFIWKVKAITTDLQTLKRRRKNKSFLVKKAKTQGNLFMTTLFHRENQFPILRSRIDKYLGI